MRYFLSLVVLLFLSSCVNNQKTAPKQASTIAKVEQSVIPTVDYEGLKPLLNKKDEKIHVINFWATWCKPCVDELPYFEKINKEFHEKGVEVTLVSLDFSNQIESKLIPFIQNNKLQSEVVVLDDPKQNVWINAIDESWSGSIPATIIYNKNKRAFYEQSFDEQTLIKELDKFLN